MAKYLFTAKKRFVAAHRIPEVLLPFVRELGDLLEAIGIFSEDDRWTEAADKIRDVRAALLKPSAFYEKVRAIEERLNEELDLEETTVSEKPLPWWPPRKGMARIIALAPKLTRRRR